MSEMVPAAESYIDYRLKQLAQRNEHHTFEVIATRIARKRISANIHLANGPVSAGGDQQRDAESYLTRIPLELPNASGFSASASASPIVLACTVQSKNLRGKVMADIEGICAEDAAPVEHIAFFSVHSIPEAQSHQLQKMARERFGVSLDIFSGMKVATMLAERDLIWLARHYLEMPASMVPAYEESGTPAWYDELLEHLRINGGPAALSPAAQGEIAEGLRHATWEKEANADLPEWIEFMEPFLAHDVHDELTFRACYEIAIAKYRGMGSSGDVDSLVRQAVDYACTSGYPHILDDAVTLLTYWGAMWSWGVAEATASDIAAARERLREHLLAQLATADRDIYPVRAATLTASLASLHLQFRWEVAEVEGYRPRKRAATAFVGEKLEASLADRGFPEGSHLADLDSAMTYLTDLVDLLPVARAFSAAGVARVFTLFTPALATHPDYKKVRDGLDAAVSLVEGDAAIAEKCRDRAVQLVDADMPVEALAELHNARTRWFHGASMYGSITASRFMAVIYHQLGLSTAAKMHAFAAAAMAAQMPTDEVRALIPEAFLDAARYAQLSGAWVDAAAITDIALAMHGTFSPDPFNFDAHPQLHHHQGNDLMSLAAVRSYWPDYESLLADSHSRTDWFEQLSGMMQDPADLYSYNETEYQRLAREQFSGPVFSDLGTRRRIDFEALGTRWVFTFDNNRDSVLAAEGFVAALQVFLVDIARLHPVLIRAVTYVDVTVADSWGSVVDDDDEDIQVRLTLPAEAPSVERHQVDLAAQCMDLLQSVHVRPGAELLGMLEPLMRDGLPLKLVVGRPYQELGDLLPDNHYTRCALATPPPSSDGFIPRSSEALAPSTRRGAGYQRANSIQRIRERYEAAEAWGHSIEEFLLDDRGHDAVARLRADGWLDWQILVTIANIGLNWRMQQEDIDPRFVPPDVARGLLRRAEDPAEPRLPLEVILEQLDQFLFVQTSAVAKTWDLRTRTESAGKGTLRDLLARRYHYGDDDVPHRDLLEGVRGGEPFVEETAGA